MDDRARVFLLSLAAIPACGPKVNGPGGGGGGDGGDPGNLRESCEAFFGKQFECYAEQYGYDYDYDPAEYCKYYEAYIEDYGDDCAGALEEVFACMSRLNCEQLMSDVVEDSCRDEYLRGHGNCPELFPYCFGAGTSGDGCSFQAQDCIDGKDYELRCDAPAAGARTCSCFVDNAPTGSFVTEGEFCDYDSLDALTVANCGWPSGVF